MSKSHIIGKSDLATGVVDLFLTKVPCYLRVFLACTEPEAELEPTLNMSLRGAFLGPSLIGGDLEGAVGVVDFRY